MNLLDAVLRTARFFGYDAAKDNRKRRAPDGINRSEDAEADSDKRAKLQSSARDLQRNFPTVGWMVRKHLDYVSTFSFQSKHADAGINKTVEALMREWSKAENCDAAGRHSFARMIRMLEQGRTLDGDIGLLRLADGRLQAIEGDRIRTPYGGVAGLNASQLIHGVQVDEAGKALAYAICNRGKMGALGAGGIGYEFKRMESAANLWLHGYYQRFDQVRGIAPLAPAINCLQDIYEGCDYALAKMKISQLFGLTVKRKSDDELSPTSTTDPTKKRKKIDFGNGPVVLDLDVGEDAAFLESHSPSSEFQSFAQTMTGIALKGLDIPFSFYAEDFTSWSGQRQAWIQYDLSARNKRQDNVDLLDSITRWRLALWILEGKLPRSLDLSVPFWRWISVGVPWVDPLKEVQADVAALAAALTSRTRILKAQGEDFDEVIEELAYETKALEARGLSTTVSPSNAQIVEVAPSNAA